MLRGIEKGGCGELPPSGSAKGTVVSSGPTSRAIDAPNGVRAGAGCFVVSAGLAMLVLRCAPSSLNYFPIQHGHGADTGLPTKEAPLLSGAQGIDIVQEFGCGDRI